MKKWLGAAIVAPFVVGVLSACSSGGGGGAPPVSPPPVSPPPPPPAPSLVNLTTNEEFHGITGSRFATGVPASSYAYLLRDQRNTAEYSGAIAYDAATETFTITIDIVNLGEETYSQSFGPGDIVGSESDDGVTVYERDGDRFVMTKPESAGLEHVTSVVWSSDDVFDDLASLPGTTVSDVRGSSVFGFRTEFGDMPNAGEATYTLSLVGFGGAELNGEIAGDGALTADFALGLVQTTLSIDAVDASGVQTPLIVLSGPATLSSGSPGQTKSHFSGTLFTVDGVNGGSYQGGFFGPNAQEVGGAFYASFNVVPDSVVGAFVGAADSANAPPHAPNPSLTNLSVSEIFGGRASALFVLEAGLGMSPYPVLESQENSVAYDAQTDTFKAPIGSTLFGNALWEDDELARNGVVLLAPTDVDASGGGADRTDYNVLGGRYTVFTPGQSEYALSYAAIGEWVDTDFILGDSLLSHNYAVYGKLSNDAPISGSAVYAITARGVYQTEAAQSDLGGDGALTADFGAATVGLDMDLWLVDAGGGETPWHTITMSEPGVIQRITEFAGSERASFSSMIGATDDDTRGQLEGDFFGPGAAEVGGVFYLFDNDPAAPPGEPITESAVGAFVGAR